MQAQEIIFLGVALSLVAVPFVRPPGPTARQVDAELTRLVERATAELVQEHLERSPLAVHLRVRHGLRGASLCVEAQDLWLRLHLYREPPRVPGGPALTAGTVRLVGLRFAASRGWEVRLDGSPYPDPILLGWRVEIRIRPRPAPSGAAASAWWAG
jgi:hypothetical protein